MFKFESVKANNIQVSIFIPEHTFDSTKVTKRIVLHLCLRGSATFHFGHIPLARGWKSGLDSLNNNPKSSLF